MIETCYKIRLTRKQLLGAFDMLRFDGAFDAKLIDDDTVEVKCLHYTEGRWHSFVVEPQSVLDYKVPGSTYTEAMRKHDGFITALRLFQWIRPSDSHHMAVVEGGI